MRRDGKAALAAFFVARLTSGRTPLTLHAMDAQNLRKAAALALAGEWARAHGIVQQDEDDPTACWIHAVLHRIEGDPGNARYWYRRARRAAPAELAPDAELREILSGLR